MDLNGFEYGNAANLLSICGTSFIFYKLGNHVAVSINTMNI